MCFKPLQLNWSTFLSIQFFSDVKEAEEKIKKIQDTMKRKYTCDRTITVTRLEDLLQDAAVGLFTSVLLL